MPPTRVTVATVIAVLEELLELIVSDVRKEVKRQN